jgi:vacuolar-type H+-ATPase subunit E/Vma4
MGQDPSAGGLFTAIEKTAEGERTAILSAAEARAREIGTRGLEEGERRKAEALRRLEKQLAGEEQRILGEARMEARNERLAAKRRCIAAAFRGAREEILHRSASGEYPAALDRLVKEAAAAAGEPEMLEVREADAAACRAKLAARGVAVRGVVGDPGTTVALARNGKVRVDNSLLARLARAESSEESAVARLLFGAGGEGP